MPAIVKRTDCEVFYTLCSEEEKPAFSKIRQLVDEKPCKLGKARHLYDFYQKALSFGQQLGGEKKNSYLQLLLNNHGKYIPRVGAPPLPLDFFPIINALAGKATPIADPVIVDSKNDDQINEAAKALDQLSYEGVGRSFGVRVYKAIIRSDAGFCSIIRNEEEDIIGGLLGTLVKIEGVAVLHLWICARKANYPKNEIATKFFSLGDSVIKKYQPDFISLEVEEDNKVKNLYEQLGFEKIDSRYSPFTRWVTDYMVLPLAKQETQPPKMSQVAEEVTKQSVLILGRYEAIAAQFKFIAERKLYDFLYP